MPDHTLIEAAIEYLTHDVADLWEAQTRSVLHSWQTFQVEIQLLYPGSDGERLYSVMDLERAVEVSSMRGIFTRGDLGEYHCQFVQISTYLLQQHLIEWRHVNQLYIASFGTTTRHRIEHHLSLRLPNQHPRLDPYTMEQIYESAEFVLTGTSTLPSTSPQQTIYPSSYPAPHPTVTQTAVYPPLPYELPTTTQTTILPKPEPVDHFTSINAVEVMF
jgi:hypothetical protein